MRVLLALLFLAVSAQAQFSSGLSLNGTAPRPRPLLIVSDTNLAVGGGWQFEIPDRPAGHRAFEFTQSHTWLPLAGGQNRSSSVHPGFEFGEGDGIHIRHWFLGADGGQVLPWMSTGRMVGPEWGPTEPASPGEFLEPSEWPAAHASGDPSVYWGPGPFSIDEPRRFTSVQILNPGWLCPTPGETLTYAPVVWWDVQGWPGGHEWPFAIDWRSTTILWGRWLP